MSTSPESRRQPAQPNGSAPAIRRVRLHASAQGLDRRVTLWREDLADLALADTVAAQRYAEPAPARCAVPLASLRCRPADDAEQASELLYGETFHVLEVSGDWAWGQCAHDGYVGYVAVSQLTSAASLPEATHWVQAPACHLYAGPSIKSPGALPLPMLARLAVAPGEDRLVATDGGYCPAGALSPLGAWQSDPVAVAERLLETPYLWGGRSRFGIDCSGLIQTSLMACGLPCPRDSDMQRALGADVPDSHWADGLQRGDLVFFKGHVGWMQDRQTLLHANAWWMAVVAEPLADVVARLQTQTDRPIEAVRRLT